MHGVNRHSGICFHRSGWYTRRSFLLKAFSVHYLAIFLLSVKFRIISLVLCVSRLPEAQQRVGGCFLNLMPQMKTLYLAYCANHPSAVNVLTEHRCVHLDILPERKRLLGVPSKTMLLFTWFFNNENFILITPQHLCLRNTAKKSLKCWLVLFVIKKDVFIEASLSPFSLEPFGQWVGGAGKYSGI